VQTLVRRCPHALPWALPACPGSSMRASTGWRAAPRRTADAGVSEAAVAAVLEQRGISLQQLRDYAAAIRLGLEECTTTEGWQPVSDGGPAGLRLWYRCAARVARSRCGLGVLASSGVVGELLPALAGAWAGAQASWTCACAWSLREAAYQGPGGALPQHTRPGHGVGRSSRGCCRRCPPAGTRLAAPCTASRRPACWTPLWRSRWPWPVNSTSSPAGPTT
jgi:hypothetical protein